MYMGFFRMNVHVSTLLESIFPQELFTNIQNGKNLYLLKLHTQKKNRIKLVKLN